LPKIAILMTTFLRNKLANITIQSILPQLSEDCILLIADQNKPEQQLILDPNWNYVFYYSLPYDCGLSFARNYLVDRAFEMNVPYCLLIADSIQFLQVYNFQPFIEFLEEKPERGLVGFDLLKKKCPWEYNMKLTESGIKFSHSDKTVEFKGITFLKCDICTNVFLAKTKTLLNLWDNEQKLAEHELAFFEYKKRGYEVHWTDSIQLRRYALQTEEYTICRKRWKDYKDLAKRKLGIGGWIILPKN